MEGVGEFDGFGRPRRRRKGRGVCAEWEGGNFGVKVRSGRIAAGATRFGRLAAAGYWLCGCSLGLRGASPPAKTAQGAEGSATNL